MNKNLYVKGKIQVDRSKFLSFRMELDKLMEGRFFIDTEMDEKTYLKFQGYVTLKEEIPLVEIIESYAGELADEVEGFLIETSYDIEEEKVSKSWFKKGKKTKTKGLE